MPNVKKKDGSVKKFPYTAEGERAAKAYAKATGGEYMAHKDTKKPDKTKGKGYGKR